MWQTEKLHQWEGGFTSKKLMEEAGIVLGKVND